jgi:hypothetical protein
MGAREKQKLLSWEAWNQLNNQSENCIRVTGRFPKLLGSIIFAKCKIIP